MRKPPVPRPPAGPAPAVLPLRVRRHEFARDAIWDAAIGLLARKGFGETTVDDIVAAAGTSRRSFFRFFQSKSDLLAQPLLGFGESLREAVAACPPSSSAAEVLRETVLRVVSGVAANPRSRRVMEVTAAHPEARTALLARVAELQDRVTEAFACRPDVPPEAAPALGAVAFAIVGTVCQRWLERGDALDLARTVDEVLAAVAGAVGAPAPRVTRGRRRAR